jgi:XTP/dITP diphosphohydrolase
MKELVLATRNKHKIVELKTLLADLGLELLTLDEFPQLPPLIEDGNTFAENALKKARAVFQYTKLPALADDSGLEVFYLNGRPGIFSARYAGSNATDQQNNEKLLSQMRGVPPRRRHAQFRAAVALVGPGYEEVAEGICTGKLAEEARGSNGFGYDPIFLPDGYDRTYAQLTSEEKNRISHRAKAIAAAKELIRKKILGL